MFQTTYSHYTQKCRNFHKEHSVFLLKSVFSKQPKGMEEFIQSQKVNKSIYFFPNTLKIALQNSCNPEFFKL